MQALAGRNDNGRYKALIGPRLRVPGFAAQQTEAVIGVAVLEPDAGGRTPELCPQPAGCFITSGGIGSAHPSLCQVHQRRDDLTFIRIEHRGPSVEPKILKKRRCRRRITP